VAIPPAFLEELRGRVLLSDIVGRRLRLVRSGRDWKAPCPFHAEKTPSFYVIDQKAFFHCFGCGAHGDAVGFLMRHDGLAFPDAVEQLAGLAGMEIPRPEPQEAEKYDRLKRLAEALEAAAKWFEAQLHAGAGREALAYLRRRGLDERAIAEFRLGYAPAAADALRLALTGQGYDPADLEEVGLIRRPDDGRAPYGFFRNRVIFPVADKRGRIVAFGGRILDGDGPKYVNSPEHALFHKGSVLYGLARARTAIAKGERPVVVEGYMDVIALQTAGVAGAVAPLGTALGEDQLQELWKSQLPGVARDLPPVLCFDGDEAGRRAARRAIDRILPLMGPDRSAAVAFLPKGEDPDSLVRRGGVGAVRQVLDGALPLVDSIWEFATSGRSLVTPEQRAGLRAELDDTARKIGDSQVQSLYRIELRRRFDDMFKRPGGGWREKGKPFRPPGPRPSRVTDAAALEARIVIALLVNHPFLFHENREELTEMQLPVAWEPLRDAVFTELARGPLDGNALCVHLKTSGFGPLLDEILGPNTVRHASFVRLDASEDDVRAGWREIWLRAHRRELDGELAVARCDPTRGEDRALERIGRLDKHRLELGASIDLEQKSLGAEDQPALARAIALALTAAPGHARADEAGGLTDMGA
jgi:DNA primase